MKITLLYDRNIVIYENILEINKPTLEIAREGSGEPWSFTLSADVTVGGKTVTQDWFLNTILVYIYILVYIAPL